MANHTMYWIALAVYLLATILIGYIAYKKGIRANYDIGAKASLDLDNKTLNKKES